MPDRIDTPYNPYPLLEQALLEHHTDRKGEMVDSLSAAVENNGLTAGGATPPLDLRHAGRPPKPVSVTPSQLTLRKMNMAGGYAAMLHAIAHIEFNAINLTLNAAYRFRTLPFQFVRDRVWVAKEEMYHFRLMRERLRAFGFDYGDFEAHNYLWDMACKTAYDPPLRMALVPRVLEACGLDVMPGVRAKVEQRGDSEICGVLDIIYRDEVSHAAIGNHWYQHLCRERGLEPIALFRSLIAHYDMFTFRGYMSIGARGKIGFSRFELNMLEDFRQGLKQGKRIA